MKYDLPQTATYITKYERYQVLYLTASKTPAEIVEFNGLQTDLTDFMMSGVEYNAIIADIATNTADILTKADISHASATSTYGYGTATLKGHLAATPVNGLSVTSGVLAMAAADTTNAGTVILSNTIVNDATKALTPKGVYDKLGAVSGIAPLNTSTRLPFINAPSFRGCLVYSSIDISLADNTPTLFPFDSEVYDTDSIHSTTINNTRLTVPVGVTKVRLSSNFQFATSATGFREALILKDNSSNYVGLALEKQSAVNGAYTGFSFGSPVIDVVAGNYFEVRVYQNSSAPLDVFLLGTWFAMEIIE